MRLLALMAYASIASLILTAFSEDVPAVNQLSAQEKKEGWKLLFDGKTLQGWHLYNQGNKPSVWRVDKGELQCVPNGTGSTLEHGDLVTDQTYSNFDLKFEWKISKAGNSGVFINVVERKDIPTAWASGPEYQLLEPSHYDYNADLKKRAGCLYGFAPQKNEAVTKPVGEWNQSEIKQKNGKIEFYLNGVLTAEQDLTTPEWKQKIKNTNFQHFPAFGKATKGHLALQDWMQGISFRNLKLKEE
ncbi:3-keto-disaccharide hydrolase [Siphonobacter curvatus]|nr:DUF1080 domain-containing protein [Siphonobacter curvatus]